jgi:hypothetical protein
MAKTPEEAEEASNKNNMKKTNMQKTNISEGPMTRSRTKEIAKQQLQGLYLDVVKTVQRKKLQCTIKKKVHKNLVNKIVLCKTQQLVHKN